MVASPSKERPVVHVHRGPDAPPSLEETPVSVLRKMTFARTSAVAFTGLIMVGVAGCGSSSTPAAANPAAAKTPTTSPSPTGPTPASLVAQVGLKDADLANGFTVKLIPGGDQVSGQVTLDNCGYNFTTESHRVARRQVAMLDATGKDASASNEVVAYDSVEQATLALVELRASVAHCPKNIFVAGAVAGAPALRYDSSGLVTEPNLPVKDNTVLMERVTPKGSTKPLFTVFVVERQGAVVDATYVLSTTKPTADELTSIMVLSSVTGKRLAST